MKIFETITMIQIFITKLVSTVQLEKSVSKRRLLTKITKFTGRVEGLFWDLCIKYSIYYINKDLLPFYSVQAVLPSTIL